MRERFPLLSLIEGPSDLRSVPEESLPLLAAELRELIIEVVSLNGGHLASNLGVVELTIALLSVFSGPSDKIVWDVGHQCYAHKILTGRRDSFYTLRRKGGLSGFPKRSESPYDVVETGHASTSISAALGILTGQRLLRQRGRVVAVIGDGALGGGMALEALNHAGHLGKNLIIVLNDNAMSISRNVGALSSYLSRLSESKLYTDFRSVVDSAIKSVPRYGSRLMDMVNRVKQGAKALVYSENLFSDLGFGYVGPLDGHNTGLLIDVFRRLESASPETPERPVVVHVFTKKGKGYAFAEDNPTAFHGITPFSISDGKVEKVSSQGPGFTDIFAKSLIACAREDASIVAITAAMSKGTGLSAFQEAWPERFFDVGITEQHALTFAAGLAAASLKPVVAVYSTFMQRAVDQVIHDIALPGLGVTIVMDRAGLVGEDGETHQGLYDIALFRCVPNLTLMAPSSGAELRLMLAFALREGGPCMLRFPKAPCMDLAVPESGQALESALERGRGVFVRRQGGRLLILSLGALLEQSLCAADLLAQAGIPVDVYTMRFIKPLDEAHLKAVLAGYEAAYLVEDGARRGGLGEEVSALIQAWRLSLAYSHGGADDIFLPHASRSELLTASGLDAPGIAEAAGKLLS